MSLRRCDSLPARFRPGPTPPNLPPPDHDQTAALAPPARDTVQETWKSLRKDIKNIENNLPPQTEPDSVTHGKTAGIITHNNTHTTQRNNRSVRRKITYDARVTLRENERPHLDTGQAELERGSSVVRKRTLLHRLLSWRTQECNCREQYKPKPKPECLLCTCAEVTQAAKPDKNEKLSERVRSKSVGYEAAREVAQFRRCASAGATVGTETAAALRARAALTLARRYYPEGGWGWTVTVVSTLVQVISHGLQLGGGTGAIGCSAAVRFKVSPLYTHGECIFSS